DLQDQCCEAGQCGPDQRCNKDEFRVALLGQTFAAVPGARQTVNPVTVVPGCVVRSRGVSVTAVPAEFLGSTPPRPRPDIPFAGLWSDTAQGSYCGDARACGIFRSIFSPAMKGRA